MFYNLNWTRVSIKAFIDKLNAYLAWYNENSINMSLGNICPVEYRLSLGMV
ncbi:hypothetical protein [Lacrimispora sp.]|uniref:hypothetical protein n=1 Tax=Lacrimispora sp. TaxID=2719234 RepID=UPI003FA5386E